MIVIPNIIEQTGMAVPYSVGHECVVTMNMGLITNVTVIQFDTIGGYLNIIPENIWIGSLPADVNIISNIEWTTE